MLRTGPHKTRNAQPTAGAPPPSTMERTQDPQRRPGTGVCRRVWLCAVAGTQARTAQTSASLGCRPAAIPDLKRGVSQASLQLRLRGGLCSGGRSGCGCGGASGPSFQPPPGAAPHLEGSMGAEGHTPGRSSSQLCFNFARTAEGMWGVPPRPLRTQPLATSARGGGQAGLGAQWTRGNQAQEPNEASPWAEEPLLAHSPFSASLYTRLTLA